jgi:hypothetical protein
MKKMKRIRGKLNQICTINVWSEERIEEITHIQALELRVERGKENK